MKRLLCMGLFLAAAGLLGCPDPPDDDDSTVSVEILDDNGPVSGADVVFHDATGEVVSHAQSDGQGKASAVLPHGGQVSIIESDQGDTLVTTLTGLTESRSIVIDNSFSSPDPVGSLSVSIPADAAGADYYEVEAGCGSDFLFADGAPYQVDVELDESCDLTNLSVLAVAYDINNAPIAHAQSLGVAASGGSGATSLDTWRTDWDEVSVSLTNAPAGTVGGVMLGLLQRDGLSYGFVSTQGAFGPGGGYATTLPIPAGFADGLFSWTWIENAAGDETALVQQRSSLDVSIDLSADLLPLIGSSSIDNTDPARPSVSWNAPAGLESSDFSSMSLGWSDGSQVLGWYVLNVPSQTAVRIPALPADLADQAPSSAHTLEEMLISYIDADFIDGFAGALDLYATPGFQLPDDFGYRISTTYAGNQF